MFTLSDVLRVVVSTLVVLTLLHTRLLLIDTQIYCFVWLCDVILQFLQHHQCFPPSWEKCKVFLF